MRNNCFKKYFCYKLSGQNTHIVVYAILNFIAVLLPCLLIADPFIKFANSIPDEDNVNFFSGNSEMEGVLAVNISFAYLCIIAASLISFVILTIMTVSSFKYYYSRAAMDTLGCLPLSYKERFWGDYLSELCAYLISYLPFMIISLLITASMNAVAFKMNDIYYSDFPKFLQQSMIMGLLIYISIHAVTAFIVSCCGKFSSSVTFSIIAMLIIPGLFIAYGMTGFSSVPGVNIMSTILNSVAMLPPLGYIVSQAIMFFADQFGFNGIEYKFDTIINSPINTVIFLLITAAFIIGAYFVGKRRKAEKVGQSFVVNAVYHAISLMLVAVIIVLTVFFSLSEGDVSDIGILLKSFGLSFIVYFALEISRKKNFKGIWKTLLRYAGAFAVSLGALIITKNTDGFGLTYRLPSSENVTEICVIGDYFYGTYDSDYFEKNTIIFRADEAISGILDEHKKLLDRADELSTGEMIKIIYKLNNGSEVTRSYDCSSNCDAIKIFSENIKKLPVFQNASLGFLDAPVYDELEIIIERSDENGGKLSKVVRPEKAEEFIKLLKFDLENNYFKDEDQNYNMLGRVLIYSGGRLKNVYHIMTNYTQIPAFLDNNNNFARADEMKKAERYDIVFHSIDDSALNYMYVFVYVNDESYTAKELLSYIETVEDVSEEYSDVLLVDDHNNSHTVTYGIRKKNEKAAVKAMLTLFREKNAQ